MMPNDSANSPEHNGPENVEPVRKSVRVQSTPAVAFRVFTEEMDTWWPRDYHVGDSPMTHIRIEGRPGGRVYSDQENGRLCQWGSVVIWEPPTRFVMAWQVSPDWKPEPDLSKSSEIEVVFTPLGPTETLVKLEHRYFERHKGAFRQMRQMVDSEGGWGNLLQLFSQKAKSNGGDLAGFEKL